MYCSYHCIQGGFQQNEKFRMPSLFILFYPYTTSTVGTVQARVRYKGVDIPYIITVVTKIT